jgi:hypothetical protein
MVRSRLLLLVKGLSTLTRTSQPPSHLAYPIFISFYTTATCRLAMRDRKLPRRAFGVGGDRPFLQAMYRHQPISHLNSSIEHDRSCVRMLNKNSPCQRNPHRIVAGGFVARPNFWSTSLTRHTLDLHPRLAQPHHAG